MPVLNGNLDNERFAAYSFYCTMQYTVYITQSTNIIYIGINLKTGFHFKEILFTLTLITEHPW